MRKRRYGASSPLPSSFCTSLHGLRESLKSIRAAPSTSLTTPRSIMTLTWDRVMARLQRPRWGSPKRRYFTTRAAQRPPRSCCANIVITHNAGWMTPKVARLQEVLAKLGLLAVDTQRNGFVGPRTRAALDLAASRFGCPTLRETMRDHGISAPPEWGLTHPDLFPLFRQSALFESLQHAASAVGESLDEPKFPEYRIRRWYTGWISSGDYARAVLAHAEGWRKKSTTSLGGSPSSNARYRVS